uniref:Uncharacterized protein n=1 Tax=Manihot esculenta TaxID=3983 RepID=A0A199UBB3_MANES
MMLILFVIWSSRLYNRQCNFFNYSFFCLVPWKYRQKHRI